MSHEKYKRNILTEKAKIFHENCATLRYKEASKITQMEQLEFRI